MHETSVFWLRIAAALYFIGLLHTLLTLVRQRSSLFRLAHSAFLVGVILHMVSIVELALAERQLPLGDFYQSVSVLAFFIALLFLFVWWRYQFAPLSLFSFPLVFLLTVIGATQEPVSGWANPRLRDAWLMVHVLTVLSGYAALLLTAAASVFYLVRERQLKSKNLSRGLFDRLPPLGTLDNIITKSLEFCFVFFTVGVLAGITWAFIETGTKWIGDGRILVGLITWSVCLITLFLRSMAGWRGRRAAIISITLTGCAVFTWASHVGLRALLLR
ncbi:MAG: cytochrome c biogenesis protein CcsA [Bryobacteraceae bacterium]|nr:cytochrome c biogenesis protein CcsA [Bryobacteraceae bacterium]